MKNLALVISLFIVVVLNAQKPEVVNIETPDGSLDVSFINHASLMFEYNGRIVYVDPVPNYFDYDEAPKADYIFITHHHGDHFNYDVITKLFKEDTKLVLTKKCVELTEGLGNSIQMKNGDVKSFGSIKLLAIPAYNMKHKRQNGEFFHPKGEGNGYVIFFDDYRVYVAGDTENIPEMKKLKKIDMAFLPMNLPYTMTPEMVADAAKAFRPKLLFPYHYGKTDTNKIIELLEGEEDIKVEIKKM